MRIALCQVNPTVGDFAANQRMILDWYAQAVKAGADLVIFPELVATGYPPQDLLMERAFIDQNIRVVKDVAARVGEVPLIMGYVRRVERKLYNTAVLCQNQSVVDVYDKMLLPTYDVFDEDRYFEQGQIPGIWHLKIGGEQTVLGIEICEDLWDHDYNLPISSLLKGAGAEMIINISASPYHERRLQDRAELIRSKVEEIRIPFLYCNMVGAQDELIFDGNSLALSGDGEWLEQGTSFKEDLVMVDMDKSPSRKGLSTMDREEELHLALSLGIRDYFRKTGHTDAVIGLSGGIDSALTAVMAADALGPEHVHGIYMPSTFSSDHSRSDAKQLARNLGIHYEEVAVQSIVDEFASGLKPLFAGQPRDVTEENVQARVRGNLLMALSNKFGWLVLSTGNKTELALGYCTLYGDMSGGLSVISDLSKTDVYAVSRWVNESTGKERIPVNCLTKPPSAELAPDQVDPFDYDVVSPIVDAIIEEHKSPAMLVKTGFPEALVYDVYQKIRINEYKRRQAATGLRVSPKAFGLGRRIPIVNHFDGRDHE